jgi:hypothetical protein
MMRPGTMLAAMLVMLTAGGTPRSRQNGNAHLILCSRGLGRTTSTPHRMVRCGLLHSRPANSAGSIPGPGNRI